MECLDFRAALAELPAYHREALMLVGGCGPAPGSVPDAKAEAINMCDIGHN